MRVFALSVFAAAIAAPGTASSPKPDEIPVLQLVTAFSEARNKFDAAALDGLLTPDYVEVSPLGEIDRRPAVLGFYSADKATPVPPMRFATEDVRRFDDTAIVIGSVTFTMPGPDAATSARTMRVTFVERRIGGRWLMASAQYTGVRPAPTAK